MWRQHSKRGAQTTLPPTLRYARATPSFAALEDRLPEGEGTGARGRRDASRLGGGEQACDLLEDQRRVQRVDTAVAVRLAGGGAVRKDEEASGADAGRWDVGACEELLQSRALRFAGDEKDTNPGGREDGHREREARVIGPFDAEDTLAGNVEGWIVGEERGGMAVLAEAVEDNVERGEAWAEDGGELAFVLFWIARFTEHAVYLRFNFREKRGVRHTVVGVGMIGRDAALVAEEDIGLRPGQIESRELFIDCARRLAAGEDERARTERGDVLGGFAREVVEDDELPIYLRCHRRGAMSVAASGGPHVPAW